MADLIVIRDHLLATARSVRDFARENLGLYGFICGGIGAWFTAFAAYVWSFYL